MAPISELQKVQYLPLRDGSDLDLLEDAPGCDTDTLLQHSEQRAQKNTRILKFITGVTLPLNIILFFGLFFLLKYPHVVVSDQRCARQLSALGTEPYFFLTSFLSFASSSVL